MADIVWEKVAEAVAEIAFNECGIATIELQNKKIGLAVVNDAYYAFQYQCPHANGKMVQGYITSKEEIVCPLHQYKFSLATGKNTSGEGYYLKTYPVLVNEEGVFIGTANKKWSFW
jgi:nitrite reductase/ring-hydroxylating ferredoxin subunit